MTRVLTVLVLVWLVIGAAAAYQRDYFSDKRTNCAEAGTIAVTVAAGPLNYTGLNPKVKDCETPDVDTPEPSR
ncbi:hypothetical protein DDE18_20890 [Nocardioides gansuensis]|uniref:Uncharacterized protein n=1 Tax=Nocardioides gansuensis TaxID=2138300 RepID=A0A2T8F556_9ACTN|nr:hypothetical protein [Nocardioides gansuensis]PVG80848.1 hypothetical protein DDE18_20890 [Nocardioides gansuensis]